MQFKAFEENIEVNGQTVLALVDGMGDYRTVGEKFLSDNGIGWQKNGKWIFDRESWYPQQAWLDAFRAIAQKVGNGILYRIGFTIPNNAKFPGWVTDLHTAIKSIDVAYHLNHRKKGVGCLFDVEKGVMYEGIGHYGYNPTPNRDHIISISHNPYPCAFDRGVITSLAQRYNLKASVVHDETELCRAKGDETCTYIISW